MQVIFESRDPAGAQLRELAERRVRFVMRRLSWLIPRAKVRLTDVNGPRGGVDKCCRLELKTDHIGIVSITSMARDWRCALEGSLSRGAQVLLRNYRRSRNVERFRHRATNIDG